MKIKFRFRNKHLELNTPFIYFMFLYKPKANIAYKLYLFNLVFTFIFKSRSNT